MTLDYPLRIRDRASQEIVAEQLDFAIRHGALRGRDAALAQRVIRNAVRRLLERKSLSFDEEQRLRSRWEDYIA